MSPRSLTLPFGTAGESRGGPGRAPLPFQVIKSPAAGQILAAKHTPRARGFSAGHRGCHRPPPVVPAGQAEPPPHLGTHRRGFISSALALHACRGDPMPAPAPAQNRRQRYPDLCHPGGDPSPNTSGWQLRNNRAWAEGMLCAPKVPSPPSRGARGPRVSPSSAPPRVATAGGGTSQPQGLSRGGLCLWVMPP